MKIYIPYSLILAAASCGVAFGAATAYTTPVGYETVTLAPNTYNLTGVRLFKPSVAAGTFDSFSSSTLVDNQAAFSLVATTNYIVEFPSGATITALGSNFSGTTLSNLTGINASYVGPYIIREALTIASVFGASNAAGIASSPNANPTEADLIYLPDGVGGFVQVFYSTFVDTEAATVEEQQLFFGWLNATTFAKAPNEVINPERGYFVQTQASIAPVVFTVSGEIKKTPTTLIANDSFSLIGGVYPAGATLATSGMSGFITGSPNANPTEADVILLPDGAGGFTQGFYSTFVDSEAATVEEQQLFFGWLNAVTFAKIPNEPLTPGFFIQKIGPNILGTHTPPAFYSNL